MMIDSSSVKIDKLSTTKRMICREVLSRGWKFWLYHESSSLLRIRRDDGKILEIFSATPPTTAYNSGLRANNKFITGLHLGENNLPVPKTSLINELKDAKDAAAKMLEGGQKIVIKPLDAAHGHGITVGISKLSEVEAAVKIATEYSDVIIIQEYIEQPVDLRLTCVNYKYVAGLIRIPARVKTDGQHTIRQLIELENTNPQRGINYVKPLNVIDDKLAEAYLKEALDTIPPAGGYVAVLGVANVGTGGETMDITGDTPDWLAEMAERAAKLAELPVCGVDFIVQKKPEPGDALKDLSPKIIEVNICPALYLHETPTFGKPQPVIKAYVDYLASI